jgi:DNA-directed RNA polymerase specialized sigma24 family protein
MTLKKLRKKLVYVAFKKTNNWQDAEDIAHDALLAAFEELGIDETLFTKKKFDKLVFRNLYKAYYRKLQTLSKERDAIQSMKEGMLGEELNDKIESGEYSDAEIGSRVRITIR